MTTHKAGAGSNADKPNPCLKVSVPWSSISPTWCIGGVSAPLAIDETVVDMMNAGRSVYVVTVHGQPRQRLENMGILQRMPKHHVVEDRLAAMEHALYGDKPQSQAAGTSTASMYSIG